MKIQRILAATIKNVDGKSSFQIVLAYTSRKDFAVLDYCEELAYADHQDSHFLTFNQAYNAFNSRCSRHGQEAYDSIEYSARQAGQDSIIWENLLDRINKG